MFHIKNNHSPSVPYFCNQGLCKMSFYDFKALERHLKKCQEHTQVKNKQTSAFLIPSDLEFIASNQETSGFDQMMDSIHDDDDDNFNDYHNLIRKKAFMIMMGFKSRSRISESVLNEFLTTFNQLIEEIVEKIEKIANETFKKDKESEEAKEFSAKINNFRNPFDFIKSKYRQQKELNKTGMMVHPQSIYLDKRLDTVLKNNESIQVYKDITFEYVSIRETVQKLIENKNIKQAIDESSMLVDKFPKEYFKNHELFKEKRNLKILLYYDGLQMTNALGDTDGVYKAGMFYFAIENLTRRHNSCLKNIFLVAILFDQDIKSYGFEKVSSLIMNDICFLETKGIEIDGDLYRASIAQFVADNLGIHEVFNLKCCFIGENICHLCNASSITIQELHSTDLFEKYTKEKYEIDVKNGKYKPCLLNSSNYFHITDNYAFDLTHDLWAGIVPLELALLFTHLTSKNVKAFELDFLNMRIKSFSYKGSEGTNKPNPILKIVKGNQIKVRQKAAKMACLFRVLPFLIGDKIDQNDKHWELYLLLSRIIDILYTRETSVGVTYELEILIREHHERFKLLYPQVTLKKKHHNMIHYGESIRRLGNLIDYATIRFEAKHSYFKTSFETSNNTINVPKHLSNKHQTTFAYNLIQDNQLNIKLKLHSPIDTKFSNLKSSLQQLVTETSCISHLDSLKLANSFEYFGLTYNKNMVFIYDEDDETFCRFDYILCRGSDNFIIATLLESTCYNSHYHAYEVVPGKKQVIFNINRLSNSYPVSIYQSLNPSDSNSYIRTQSFVI